jgi:hypothetical protein
MVRMHLRLVKPEGRRHGPPIAKVRTASLGPSTLSNHGWALSANRRSRMAGDAS